MARTNGKGTNGSVAVEVATGTTAAVSETASLVQSAAETMAAVRASLQNQLASLDAILAQANADRAVILEALGEPAAPVSRGRGRTVGSKDKAPRKPRGSKAAGTATTSAPRTRRNETNLPGAIKALLAHAGPLSVAEIAVQVRQAPVGYVTTAEKSWTSIVQQVFTNYSVDFKRDGSLRTDKGGNPVGKGDNPGMFVRIARGIYDNVQANDTAERVEKRGEKYLAAHAPAAAAA